MKVMRKIYAVLLLVAATTAITACNNEISSELPITPLYSVTIEDVSLLLGDTHEINATFTPVDYIALYDYEIVYASPVDCIAIENGLIYASTVGHATVKANASNMEGAAVVFHTSTLFNVEVNYEKRQLSSETSLSELKINGIAVSLTEGDTTTEIDYTLFNDLVAHKEDVRPLLSAKLSQYASISAAVFELGSEAQTGTLTINVIAEDGITSQQYKVNIAGYYISNWIELPLVNGDFETGSSAEGWDLVNFKDRYVTSTASSIDLTPIKSPATRVFTIYDKVIDEKKVASLTQKVENANFKAGDLLELSCVISTSYGTRIKSIKLIAGMQHIECEDMVPNWRAQIIKQQFTLSEADIVDGKVEIGLSFIAQDETSTSQGWMYLDDFVLNYLNKIYPEG